MAQGQPVRRAVVLAAGEGTRLRPLTLSRPKALVEVAGVPVLEHLLSLLTMHGVREVAINLHYLPDAIVDYAGDGRRWGLALTYLREPVLLGSGGTLRALAHFLSEPFLLLYGDVVTDADLQTLAREHRSRRAALTCLLHRVPDPWTKGVADLAPDGRLRRFIEKPPRGAEPSDLVATGIYVAETTIVPLIPDRLPCDFGADVMPAVLAAGLPVVGVEAAPTTYIRDIGTPEALAAANDDAGHGRIRMLRHNTSCFDAPRPL